MEHSHWTALQTVYPPDQIKTINWASLNKHIHNSLDLLRQSANSLNELTHTSSSSQNLPLWTCLPTDLSYLEVKTPTGCGSDKERDGAAVVVPQQLLGHGVTCHLQNSWCDCHGSGVYPTHTQAGPGSSWGFCLEIFCNFLAIVTYLQEGKQEWKQIHEKQWTANHHQALNNKSPASPPTQWSTKHSQTSFATPSLNISSEFRVNDFSLEQTVCWVTPHTSSQSLLENKQKHCPALPQLHAPS